MDQEYINQIKLKYPKLDEKIIKDIINIITETRKTYSYRRASP